MFRNALLFSYIKKLFIIIAAFHRARRIMLVKNCYIVVTYRFFGLIEKFEVYYSSMMPLIKF